VGGGEGGNYQIDEFVFLTKCFLVNLTHNQNRSPASVKKAKQVLVRSAKPELLKPSIC
jgi:hypothetical protein